MKITMQPAISLDGFIAKSDGDSSSWVNQADEARYQAVVEKAGCVLVGHTTYEQYTDDFNAYKNVTVFVCTTATSYIDTEKVKYVRGTAHEIVQEVEKYGFDELIVCGGGKVNGLLAVAGLVDEIAVSIQPVVLGGGIPLFGDLRPNLKLELQTVNQEIEGVVQHSYKIKK